MKHAAKPASSRHPGRASSPSSTSISGNNVLIYPWLLFIAKVVRKNNATRQRHICLHPWTHKQFYETERQRQQDLSWFQHSQVLHTSKWSELAVLTITVPVASSPTWRTQLCICDSAIILLLLYSQFPEFLKWHTESAAASASAKRHSSCGVSSVKLEHQYCMKFTVAEQPIRNNARGINALAQFVNQQPWQWSVGAYISWAVQLHCGKKLEFSSFPCLQWFEENQSVTSLDFVPVELNLTPFSDMRHQILPHVWTFLLCTCQSSLWKIEAPELRTHGNCTGISCYWYENPVQSCTEPLQKAVAPLCAQLWRFNLKSSHALPRQRLPCMCGRTARGSIEKQLDLASPSPNICDANCNTCRKRHICCTCPVCMCSACVFSLNNQIKMAFWVKPYPKSATSRQANDLFAWLFADYLS